VPLKTLAQRCLAVRSVQLHEGSYRRLTKQDSPASGWRLGGSFVGGEKQKEGRRDAAHGRRLAARAGGTDGEAALNEFSPAAASSDYLEYETSCDRTKSTHCPAPL
jgi:hypothetical protein